MSQQLDVCIAPDRAPLPEFIRGSSFIFTMELPPHIQKGQLADYALSCQLRRLANDSPSGLIADIQVEFADPDCTTIRFTHHDTSEWPVGPAEFDVLFTKISDPQVKHRSLPVRINIVNGVTQG